MPALYDLARRCFGYKFPRLGLAANNLFFRLVPREIDTELFPGIHVRLDSSDLIQRTTYWQGDRFEYPTAEILTTWISPSITHFFDIGANYGFFSYLMLSSSRELLVHAFEPNPLTFQHIEQIKERNELDRFHPHLMGLSNVSDKLFLHLGGEDSGHCTFGEHPGLVERSTAQIAVEPFDLWREAAGVRLPETPSWLAKIDVEGFELNVLKGMAESLRLKAFAGLVVEVNPFTLNFNGTAPDEIFSFMDAVGYRADPRSSSRESANAFFMPGR